MESDIPEDIYIFLFQSGIDERRMDIYKRNFINNFTSPNIIAEIIHNKYPKLVLMHHFIDGNSAKTRMDNWKVLNKILAKLRCNFLDSEIDKLVNRSVKKDELYTFMRFLRSKMESYEPLYLSKTTSGESMPEAKQRRCSMLTGAIIPKTTTSSSSAPSKLITKATMSAEEIDKTYLILSQRLKLRNKSITQEVDSMQERSERNNAELMMLKNQNLEELEKTEKSIEKLNHELSLISVSSENGSSKESIFKFNH